MKPKEFKEQNVIFGKDQQGVEPLPGYLDPTPARELVTCWELNEEEKKKIMQTGEIWLTVMTYGKPLQPVCLMVDRPFLEPDEVEEINKSKDQENE